MVAGALFSAVMSLLVKIAGQRLPTMEIVLARSVVMGFLSFVLVRRRGKSLLGGSWGLLLLRSAFGFGALICFFYAVIHLPLADATVLHFVNPVFTAILAGIALGEVVGRREVLLALTSLGGVVLVARPTFLFRGAASSLDPVAVGVALVGALGSAAAYTTIRRIGRSEDAFVIIFYFAAFSSLASLPFVIPRWVRPVGAEWLVLLGVGVATFLGQIFITWGLQLERAGRAMAVAYLQIVFAAGLGLAVFAEIPDRWSVLGGLVIVGATFHLARMPSSPAGLGPVRSGRRE